MKKLYRFRSALLVGLSLFALTACAWANPASPTPPVERPSGSVLMILGGAGLLAVLFGGKVRRSDRL
jgi:hypothetical protein